MNILYLNTTHICGGAEKVTNQIMYGMQKRGHQIYEIVSYYKRPEPLGQEVSVLYQSTPMLLFNRVITGNHSNASLSIPYSFHKIKSFIQKNHIDIVHLHNPHGNFLGIRDIGRIADLAPVVWTLHDFWALTGHCTYPTDCTDKWKTGCSTCEQLQNYPPIRKDIAHRLLNEKTASFHHPNIHYTVPSEWMMKQFQESHLKDTDCQCIPNSLDTSLWLPLEKQALRKKYNLPTNKRILAFVAADPAKRLKGMHLLLEALKILPHPEQYLLLIAGQEHGTEALEQSGFAIRHFGYLTEQTKMNEFYALADLLINPSLYETFGLVNIEAMASGTPVIAFSVCAMEEIISPDCGWCISPGNCEQLAQTIASAFTSDEALINRSQSSRQRILQIYSEESMLSAYENLYKKVVS